MGVAERLGEVRDRIAAASAPDQKVQLVTVSKRFDADTVAEAVRLGCMDLGENYAQELEAKAAALGERGLEPAWHMIGPVQRNKVKKIAAIVTLWHSVDRSSLIAEIAKRQPGARVLLQVNFAGEDTKSGVAPANIGRLVTEGTDAGLDVAGLMAMGPTDTSVDPRPVFVACRTAVDDHGLSECSIGMSGDYEAAISEGSTIVRIGSAIFGQRN